MNPQVNNPSASPSESDRLKRYLRLSFGLHAAGFSLFFLGNLLHPGDAEMFLPTVQIDMVALPDLVKSQNQPILDKTLPVKDAPPPPPKPESKEAEKIAEPKPEPAEKDDAMTLKREKDAELDAKKALERLRNQVKQAQKSAAEREREERMEKKQADMKRFEEAYRNAIKGNQVNEGTSTTGVTKETANAYYGHIEQKIRANWSLPAWLQNKGLSAQLVISIDGGGNVTSMRFAQSSGNDAFDDYVKGAVQRASPFAPPPAEMVRGLRGGLQIGFPL